MIGLEKNHLIDAGVVSEGEYNDAINELDKWLENDAAFWMALSILVTGCKM